MHVVDGVAKKAIARRFGLDIKTVRPAVSRAMPPTKRLTLRRVRTLDPWRTQIEQLLRLEPRITAKKVGLELGDRARGIKSRALRDYVRELERELFGTEAFVHRASHARRGRHARTATLCRGVIRLEFLSPGAGIAAYQRALEVRPDDAYVWLKLGFAYARSGSCALALAPCTKALELDRDLAPAWLRLAGVQLCLGELEDALAACRSAREVRLDRIHVSDAAAIIGFYGNARRFHAETYRTESNIYQALGRRLSGRTPAGMGRTEAMLQLERWLTLSDLCMTLASPELYPLETARWAYQSANERMRSNALLAADQTLIDLAATASAHLKTLDDL